MVTSWQPFMMSVPNLGTCRCHPIYRHKLTNEVFPMIHPQATMMMMTMMKMMIVTTVVCLVHVEAKIHTKWVLKQVLCALLMLTEVSSPANPSVSHQYTRLNQVCMVFFHYLNDGPAPVHLPMMKKPCSFVCLSRMMHEMSSRIALCLRVALMRTSSNSC